MAAGKNKLEKGLRLLVNGYELSGCSRTFGAAIYTEQPVDMTAWSTDTRWSILSGVHETSLTGYQAIIDDDTAGAFTAMLAPTDHYSYADTAIVSLLFGDAGATPAVGNAAFLHRFLATGFVTMFDGGLALLTADFIKRTYEDSSSNARDYGGKPWGFLLMNYLTGLASTTNGAVVNRGAASTNGAHANLHVIAAAGGAWAYTIEHSTDGIGSWSTLITFVSDGTSVEGESANVDGTVNQYVRGVATRTSGTTYFAMTFASR